MMRRILLSLALAAIAVSAGAAQSQTQAQAPSRLLGCYEFDSAGVYFHVSDARVTRVVALLAEPRPAVQMLQWVAEPVPPPADGSLAASMYRRFSGWGTTATDSIRLDISNGLHGWRFELRATGDTLVGGYMEFTDVVGAPRKTGAARAVRVTCR